MSVMNPETVVTTINGNLVTFSQTAQGKGYIYQPDGSFSIPPRTSGGIISTATSAIKTGLDIFSTVSQTISALKKQPVIPEQSATVPSILVNANRPVEQGKITGSINYPQYQLIDTARQTEYRTPVQSPEQPGSNNTVLIIAALIIGGVLLLRAAR